MLKTAVFISGRGTNLKSIIKQWKANQLDIDLSLVFSNKSDAKGLQLAEEAGILTLCIPHKEFSSREEHEMQIQDFLQKQGIEFIVLAGYMRLLSSSFVKKWSGRLINIHPSLLPAFPGLHTHKKALEYGVKYSGCSVFFVDEGVDTGAIINQAVVQVLPGDTEDTLAARVLEKEHIILPEAIQLIATRTIEYVDGKVFWNE